MANNELDSKIRELRELKHMAEELQGEIDALTDTIKAEMTERNVDELSGMDWKCSWKIVTTSRVDSALLKKSLPEVFAAFSKTTTARRFTLA